MGVRGWQEHLPLDAFWGRGHHIILRVPKGLTPHWGNLKGGINLNSILTHPKYENPSQIKQNIVYKWSCPEGIVTFLTLENLADVWKIE